MKHFMRFYTGGAKTLGLTEEMAADAKQVGMGGWKLGRSWGEGVMQLIADKYLLVG